MSTYDMANIEKTDTGIVPNRGPMTGYDVKKASKIKIKFWFIINIINILILKKENKYSRFFYNIRIIIKS